ncbi:SDR family NAD(P)-dependent oxidoreductase [Lunatibacter salilacus]|uniref:SDR family NAD(P)-dependent oxidoreductase n=1 Tax=Lunatibacter salilacus TaxID=2483804 RepID=UPI0021CE9F06|nr:SDR family oxidoreductase [Lunatibacter salilacus]
MRTLLRNYYLIVVSGIGNKITKMFKSKTVIISGGLGDIGRDIVRLFATKGASISVGDIHSTVVAQEFIEEVKQLSETKNIIYSQVDIADPTQVQKWVAETVDKLNTIDIAIPNAATATLAGIMEVSPQQWSDELKVNLNGAFYLSQFAAAEMIKLDLAGRIVLVGSWAAHSVHPNLPTYSVSKAGLSMLCKCLALELAPHHILVNEIAPGYVNAGLSKKIFETNSAAKEQAERKVPVGKVLNAEDIAEKVLWLCDFSNEHMTGSTLLVDGGLSLLS